MADGGGLWRIRFADVPRTSLYFLCFFGASMQFGWDSCPLYPLWMYLYLYGFLNFNTDMFDKKKSLVRLVSGASSVASVLSAIPLAGHAVGVAAV